MVSVRDIKSVRAISEHFTLVKRFAKGSEHDGYSNVHADRNERSAKLSENSLVGQVGEYAACVVISDFTMYESKQRKQLERGIGDGGSDIPGSTIPIDVKTCNVRRPGASLGFILNTKHLMVTEKEYSPNMIYVASIVLEAPSHSDEEAEVHVLGWCYGRDMEWAEWADRPRPGLPFGKYRCGFKIKYRDLRPMRSMHWKSLITA
jgi:hypothetical protein